MRVLRTENDQLVRVMGVPLAWWGVWSTQCVFTCCPAVQRKGKGVTAAGDGDPNLRKAGESDQNIRKVLARQHVKDISEYTKQIHTKDREIANLKRKTIKVGIHIKYRTSLNVRNVIKLPCDSKLLSLFMPCLHSADYKQ